RKRPGHTFRLLDPVAAAFEAAHLLMLLAIGIVFMQAACGVAGVCAVILQDEDTRHGEPGRGGAPAFHEHGGPDDPLHGGDLEKEPRIVALAPIGACHVGVKRAPGAEVEGAHIRHPGPGAPPFLENLRIAQRPPELCAGCGEDTHDLKIKLSLTHHQAPLPTHPCDRARLPERTPLAEPDPRDVELLRLYPAGAYTALPSLW